MTWGIVECHIVPNEDDFWSGGMIVHETLIERWPSRQLAIKRMDYLAARGELDRDATYRIEEVRHDKEIGT